MEDWGQHPCRNTSVRILSSTVHPRLAYPSAIASPKSFLPWYRLVDILTRSMHDDTFTGWRDPRLFLLALIALVSASCDFPQDPRGTLEGVQNGRMRVGIVDNDPWTHMEDGYVSGVEVELLKDFAEELEAEISFLPGTTPELLEAARQGELDVLVGGFTSTSPGVSEGKEAGITGTYLTTRLVVGVPPGTHVFEDPSGQKVAVERIDGTAALLKEEGAVPVPVDDLSAAGMPVVAYEWQLKAWGFEPTGVELPEEKHIMAVPLGENGWLVELERFLREHREEAEELLREETS
jgi:polar amino acid transport system substrate-binding protein